MATNVTDVEPVEEFLLSEEDRSRANWSSVSQEGTRYETILPGTSTFDFNRCGNLKLDSALDYFVASRTLAFFNPEFCMMEIQEGGLAYFLLQVKYYFTRHFHALAKVQHVHFAKKVIVELHYIGNSTFSLLSIIQDASTGKELARSYAKLVRVNFLERKSEPLPKGFSDKYGKYCQKTDFEMIGDVAPPPTAYSNSYLIRYSDTDQMLHVNHASYVNLCLDAATEASFKGGFLQNFTGDICERLVKSMQCSYVRECRLGETLTVTVWQDESSTNKLRFRVTKADENLTMLCIMEFHDSIGLRALL